MQKKKDSGVTTNDSCSLKNVITLLKMLTLFLYKQLWMTMEGVAICTLVWGNNWVWREFNLGIWGVKGLRASLRNKERKECRVENYKTDFC